MFKPNAKQKSALAKWDTHASIFVDGVIIDEKQRKRIQVAGQTTIQEYRVVHVVRCPILVGVTWWAKDRDTRDETRKTAIAYITVHNTRTLADGLKEIHISINSQSISMREHMPDWFNRVDYQYETPVGGQHVSVQHSYLASDWSAHFKHEYNPAEMAVFNQPRSVCSIDEALASWNLDDAIVLDNKPEVPMK